MAVNKEAYKRISEELSSKKITLVAVSKTKPLEDIQALYDLGHRDFGENYVQELVEKAAILPKDIRWHFIGHLQTNKVKLIVPVVQLIHGVDSLKLLKEINKEGAKQAKVMDCLLQVHIAKEETKFGLDERELDEIMEVVSAGSFSNTRVLGLMGMASFTDDKDIVKQEFAGLKKLFDKQSQLATGNSQLTTLSMGMSSDYGIAVEEGSTMVRIGSLLFGERGAVEK
jgi:pyridoxal phosphate enzyme (YggS family)